MNAEPTLRLLVLAVLLLATSNSQISTAFAQGTAFTYQGQLQNNGGPANGTYAMTFALFNTNASGVAIAGPVTNNAVNVHDGLFITQIDFGAEPFTGQTNWLQIGVATNGVSTFTTLSPRQQLTSTPYSIYAASANTAATANTVFAANITGTLSGSGSGLTNLNPAYLVSGTAPINITGVAASAAYINPGQAPSNGALPTTNSNYISGQTQMSGPVFVQNGPIYVEQGTNFSGAGLGLGTLQPAGSIPNFLGSGETATIYDVINGPDPGAGFGEAIANNIASPVIWMYEDTYNDFEIRTRPYPDQPLQNGVLLMSMGEGGTLTLPGTGTSTPTLNAVGTIQCCSIIITGGCDLAEPFPLSMVKDQVSEGAVMVIDKDNPGHLTLSSQPYDTKVAGVISGANDLNPGIEMQQQGLLEGGRNVALTGRVYVEADTSNGPIEPGDLLTTSVLPGRAMKVTDHARAQGAILGKAMTSMHEGQGVILVLVTLQ